MEKSSKANSVIIYTDGACRGNQEKVNLGAYSYQLIYGEKTKSFAQAVPNTTNNQMELQGAIQALKALKPSAYSLPVCLYSDSQYLVMGFNQWRFQWQAKNWSGVKNVNLWKDLIEVASQFSNLKMVKVTGHADCQGNNYVDRLCNDAMDQYLESHLGE